MFFSAASIVAASACVYAQSPVRDSLPRSYQAPAVTVTTTRAIEGRSPVTWTELSRADIVERHTAFDLPSLLAELPSTIFYSENGNAVGYSYLNIRGFDQRRIAVLINGIPQNDPEDHNVYWIDFPDLAPASMAFRCNVVRGLRTMARRQSAAPLI